MAKSSPVSSTAFIKMWWFPLVTVLVVILGTLTVLIPQLSQIMEARDTLNSSKDQLVQAESKIATLSKVDMTEMDQLAALAAGALPEHKPYFEVLALMQRLSAQTGATLGNFNLSPGSLATASSTTKEVQNLGYTELKTSVSVTGTVDQVSQFIEQLQQSAPIVSVDSIEITSQLQGTTELKQAQLTVGIYYTTPNSRKATVTFDALPDFGDKQKEVYTTLASYANTVDASASADTVTNFSRNNLFSY